MEQDFKKEYSEYLKTETPDLWGRIESGLTDKMPASKVVSMEEATTQKQQQENRTQKAGAGGRKAKKWMAAVPAAAAVVLLLVAAPIFQPKFANDTMENTAMKLAFLKDEAGKAQDDSFDEAQDAVEECAPENDGEKIETDNGAVTEENNILTGAAPAGGNQDSLYEAGVNVLHLQVLKQISPEEKYSDTTEEAKENQAEKYNLFLVLTDGEEKVLAIPIEVGMELEEQVWYDLTVTDSQESGIDYIWVE